MTFISILVMIALGAGFILLLLPRAPDSTAPADRTDRIRGFLIGAARWIVVVSAGALALAAGIAILFGGVERVFRDLQDIGCFNC